MGSQVVAVNEILLRLLVVLRWLPLFDKMAKQMRLTSNFGACV